MSKIYSKSGGYRRLYSFNFAVIVHLGTINFCRRYIPWQEDPLGKTLGQMIGASRSGKQNIIEGSERAKTSRSTEINLLDVAKCSLSELQGDLEDYLVINASIPWSIYSSEHKAVNGIMLQEFKYCDDLLHEYWKYLLAEKAKFDPWLEQGDGVTAANALIILIQRATSLLGAQLNRLEEEFLKEGGIKEKMHTARLEARRQSEEGPECPECGEAMVMRRSSRGDFWGCSAYPACRGTRKMEQDARPAPR